MSVGSTTLQRQECIVNNWIGVILNSGLGTINKQLQAKTRLKVYKWYFQWWELVEKEITWKSNVFVGEVTAQNFDQ